MVDGGTSNIFEDITCSMNYLLEDYRAWLYVDLGGVYRVLRATLVNRVYYHPHEAEASKNHICELLHKSKTRLFLKVCSSNMEYYNLKNILTFSHNIRFISNTERLGDMKIGVANSKNVGSATHCLNYTQFVPSGESLKFDLNCSNNNVGQYFYLYRNNNAYKKHLMSYCEVVLEAYPVIGKDLV